MSTSEESLLTDIKAEGKCRRSEEDWDDDSMNAREIHLRSRQVSSRTKWLTSLNICCLILSSTLFASNVFLNKKGPTWAFQQTSFYSPMFDRFDIETETKVVAGTLFNEKTLSEQDILLRTYPDAAVDQAWQEVTDVGILAITSDEVSRLGKDPENTVKVPPEWGFGDNTRLAQIDGQHALHCLNAVRRYAYRERYYPYVNESSIQHGQSPLRPFDQAHLSHCLHVLLQTLTCNPSLDMITYNWVETQDYPFPDFAINKKCMKHDKLLQWQAKNQLSQEQWVDMSVRGPRPEEPVLPMPEELRKWSEKEDQEHSKSMAA